MFVVSVKSSKIRAVAFAFFIVLICTAAFVVFEKKTSQPVLVDKEIVLRAGNEKERVAFLSQFGWEIDEEPFEVKEVTIPAEFDEMYEKYNLVQKQQDFDLEKYKGERVKQWTYNIKNYPGYENKNGYVVANILVYKGAVVGGDISCLIDGSFVKCFEFPEDLARETTKPAPKKSNSNQKEVK